MNSVWQRLFLETLWIPRDRARSIAEDAFLYMDICMDLAAQAVQERKLLLLMNSKAHALCHIFKNMVGQCDISAFALNPLMYGVQMDEDAVGRSCRITRHVSPQAAVERTLQRYLIGAYTQWENAGMLIRV